MLEIGWFQRPHPDINKDGDLAEKRPEKKERSKLKRIHIETERSDKDLDYVSDLGNRKRGESNGCRYSSDNVVDVDIEKEKSSNLANWVNESAIPQHREYRKRNSLGMVGCKILFWV